MKAQGSVGEGEGKGPELGMFTEQHGRSEAGVGVGRGWELLVDLVMALKGGPAWPLFLNAAWSEISS